jgi:hypothetical protein
MIKAGGSIWSVQCDSIGSVMCEVLLRNRVAGSLVISRLLSWEVAMRVSVWANCLSLAFYMGEHCECYKTVGVYFTVIWIKKVGENRHITQLHFGLCTQLWTQSSDRVIHCGLSRDLFFSERFDLKLISSWNITNYFLASQDICGAVGCGLWFTAAYSTLSSCRSCAVRDHQDFSGPMTDFHASDCWSIPHSTVCKIRTRVVTARIL